MYEEIDELEERLNELKGKYLGFVILVFNFIFIFFTSFFFFFFFF